MDGGAGAAGAHDGGGGGGVVMLLLVVVVVWFRDRSSFIAQTGLELTSYTAHAGLKLIVILLPLGAGLWA